MFGMYIVILDTESHIISFEGRKHERSIIAVFEKDLSLIKIKCRLSSDVMKLAFKCVS